MQLQAILAAGFLTLVALTHHCSASAGAQAGIAVISDLASLADTVFGWISGDEKAVDADLSGNNTASAAGSPDEDSDLDDVFPSDKQFDMMMDSEEAEPPTEEEKAAEARLPPGVPKYVFRMCRRDIRGHKVHVTSHGVKQCTFQNVPPTCMTLANVFVGDGQHGPRPTPCGSACLHYTGMSKKQHKKLIRALRAGHHKRDEL